ncbi:3-oxoacyl-(acyl-carrier-protein) synthase II [uncultured spirochete]|uniref:3-oxoacyl-[acyl-carrier-protein] synthase 2 n=1 Tax=uncultured spirochete TaxID=156406 RepID=A0A3P3XJ49_9SPIR|nr:beta-ketoacyl-ACP synthase II [Rectinema subterraneum]SLM13216.1 3-oxoacyl-(acyl-carrier-protein) synthase II [uncultured spirochete]
MNRRRVVVTGLGVVSPLGNDIPTFWSNVKANKSGIAPITMIDSSELAVKIAGEVKDFNPGLRLDPKESKKMDRFAQFAVCAALEALESAQLQKESLDPLRTGVCLGTGQGGSATIEEAGVRLTERGPSRVSPMTVAKGLANFGAAQIALSLGVHGPNMTVVTACAAATDAIGQAMHLIRDGHADIMFTGGSEASIVRMCMASFINIQALSSRNDAPEKASRPFDKDRDGFVMSEGAGILVLEEYEHAKARGAKIYAEIAGFGATCDAHHLTAPDPEGMWVAKAIELALNDAGMKPEDIDYISAHGTSTPLNDPIETKAIKHAFGPHAYKLKVSSLKSMIGHCIGAAGAIETIAAILGMNENYIHPTINLDNPDPECDLDYVPNKGINMPVRAFVKESMGFGGQNAVLVVTKA